jgi:hypothetical protein
MFLTYFDKLYPFSVSEIQLPYLYLYMTMHGLYIYIWQSETSVSHVSMNTANMHFSINNFKMVSRLESMQKNSISICENEIFALFVIFLKFLQKRNSLKLLKIVWSAFHMFLTLQYSSTNIQTLYTLGVRWQIKILLNRNEVITVYHKCILHFSNV